MPDTTPAHQLRIGDAVSFVHRQRTLHGHLLERQGQRRFARVIDTEERIWKVPASALTPTGGPRRTVLLTPFDAERAQWRLGDRVLFDNAGNRMEGEIVKLNPKRAQVRCGNDVWNVPYPMLRPIDSHDRARDADRLRAVAAMARGCMVRHGLEDWTLAFVESRRRLGDCQFGDRLIRIARHHAIDDSNERIRDTVLHEIAHAIAGPEAGHGPLWKAVAQSIGATPMARAYETDPG